MKLRLLTITMLGMLGLVAFALAAAPGLAAQRTGRVVTVRLGEYFFRSPHITLRVGDRVRFVNVGKIEHTVADSTKSGAILNRQINVPPLRHGQASLTLAFKKPGTIRYLCTFHPSLMRGTITITR